MNKLLLLSLARLTEPKQAAWPDGSNLQTRKNGVNSSHQE